MPNTKIATCTYCGTRAALVLTGETRHELACSACGAPLHEMKQLHPDTPPKVHKAKPVKPTKAHKPAKPKKLKKKKSLGRKLLGEAFDLIEDIFD